MSLPQATRILYDIHKRLHHYGSTLDGADKEANDQAEHAFQQLKQALTSADIMRNPVSQPFILQTDTSNVGVGVVLSQGSDNDRPIAYISNAIQQLNKSALPLCLA